MAIHSEMDAYERDKLLTTRTVLPRVMSYGLKLVERRVGYRPGGIRYLGSHEA